jgi:hypothetical protein
VVAALLVMLAGVREQRKAREAAAALPRPDSN